MECLEQELDLSKYVPADKLAPMSELERKCCANRIKNYQMMTEIGKYEIATNSFYA